jgi:hypothetical protein
MGRDLFEAVEWQVIEELGRFYIELLADVFTDLDQLAAALAAGAAGGFVAVFGARQMLRQALAPGALALGTQRGHLLLDFDFDFGFDGGAVGISRLAEQIALLRR